MKCLLALRYIEIEKANAIMGITYGFPAVTNFCGFMHLLRRKTNFKFNEIAIISHAQEIHCIKNKYKDNFFCLERYPLDKNGDTPSFIEEGKMSLTLSLILHCELEQEFSEADISFIENIILTTNMAGGFIKSIQSIEPIYLPQDEKKLLKIRKREMIKLMPGFLLIERSDLVKDNPTLDEYLYFFSTRKDKEKGYFTPIAVGYRIISDLYNPGEIKNVRDTKYPFGFVEWVYTVGQWISPHRINNFDQIFWRHDATEKGIYVCKNNFNRELIK